MQFISLKIRSKYLLHGYDENNEPLQQDFSMIKTAKFNEVIIPLSDIASIGNNHITIKEAFNRLGVYEYEHETPEFFDRIKDKLLKAKVLIN